MATTTTTSIEVKNLEGLTYLQTIENDSIDLILTDPPYVISRETGMNTFYNNIKEDNGKLKKTEKDWEIYKEQNKNIKYNETQKDNYMKYGTIYGKKYSVMTDYGDWDKNFTEEILDEFIGEYYKKLKKGGTLIIFFDLWKITPLKEMMEKHKFKQIRFIEWIKTNPQPLNSSINYLTNCREIALLGIKGGSPTFHSKYDNAIYEETIKNEVVDTIGEIYKFSIQGGKNRSHPTQKSLVLFETLIEKHSNENDIVLDTFLGGGTTAIACKNKNRKFKGCEISKEYYDIILEKLSGSF
jgi:site-specific DNA-methyltransferase (adenine-specific)